MKKKFFQILGCSFMAAFLMTACNSEESLVKDEIPVEKGKLSFILPTGGKTVTYASVQGEDNEYVVDNVRIYWFDDVTKLLVKRFASGDGTTAGGATESVDGSTFDKGAHQTVVTVTVGDYATASRFYIVANVNGSSIPMISSTGGTTTGASLTLDKVTANVTTYDDFEKILSDALAESNGALALLGAPLPMSLNEATKGNTGGYIEVAVPNNGGTFEGTLKRRVARFDILNTAAYSNFEITAVHVNRAVTKGYLHDKDLDKTESWLTSAARFDVKPADYAGVSPTPFNGPAPTSTDDNDGDGLLDVFDVKAGAAATQIGDTAWRTKAAFYLYPTILKANDASDPTDGTEIVIEGIYNKSTPRLYKLNLTADVEVKANNLYKIKVIRASEVAVRFSLEVDDWSDELEIPTVNAGITVTSWGRLKSSANASLDEDVASIANAFVYEYSTSATSPDTLTVVTEGTNLTTVGGDVTEVSYVGRGSNNLLRDLILPISVTSTTIVTYGTRYQTTHKIALLPTISPLEGTLQITNAANHLNVKTINIYSNNYNNLGIKPVKVGSLLWAPVNVGATKLQTSGTFTSDANGQAVTGNFYQWGRNLGFGYNNNTTPTVTTGPLSAADAASTTNWINSSTGDWLTPSDDNLWNGALAQGPCPDGWRVPTAAEYNTMLAGTRASLGAFIKVTNSGNDLYFPIAGNRTAAGTLDNIGKFGHYWVSDASGTTDAHRYRTDGTTATGAGDTAARSIGFSVRAVRDVTP